jgi:4-diphosphocytidyl-2-C-methyl-D-erythritol kinase
VLEPIALGAPLAAVLINPRCAVPERKTAEVFRRLAAGPLATVPDGAGAIGDVKAAIRLGRNDLEAPATALMPEIADVLAALRDAGAEVARLSGAGPTCFGVFADEDRARDAAEALRAGHPGWWIVPTMLG